MSLWLIMVGTFLATLLGGVVALRLKDKLHVVLGFSAGAILGVVFFDLLPEALELAGELYAPSDILSITALGFMGYMVLDRAVHFHNHEEGNCAHELDQKKGVLGAGSISVHSFLDGIGIGLAFQVSVAVGVIVAVAVLTHNFSDGINTVGYILKNGGNKKSALQWLCIDALAPVLGILSSFFLVLSAHQLGLLLALFSGFFLYISASNLIPESYHTHPVRLTTGMTLLGMLVLYGAIHLAGI